MVKTIGEDSLITEADFFDGPYAGIKLCPLGMEGDEGEWLVAWGHVDLEQMRVAVDDWEEVNGEAEILDGPHHVYATVSKLGDEDDAMWSWHWAGNDASTQGAVPVTFVRREV